MSRISDLLRELRAREPALARDLEREVNALSERRAFGLNFERHVPEAVELPGRKVRKGDKVRVLPPRGQTPKKSDEKLWRVVGIDRSTGRATLEPLAAVGSGDVDGQASLPDGNATLASLEDLVVVAEFRDPIYPGLVSTGKVARGGDKPFHTVINAENYHALETLLFTHRGSVDAIYIDPPYNTGAKDWKYNNNYVEADDLYRHSKWLAFMERRLLLARELLNPDDSVLIVTVDEKEYLRLGLLLEQIFPAARVQMISITISPRGTSRANEFSRVDEYVFVAFIGQVQLALDDGAAGEAVEARWQYLRRDERTSTRASGRPNQFFPIYVGTDSGRIELVGEPLPPGANRGTEPHRHGCTAVYPVKADGTEMVWGLTAPSLRQADRDGFVRVTAGTNAEQPWTIKYLRGVAKNITSGRYKVTGERSDGSKIVVMPGGKVSRPTTVWREKAHDAGAYGTSMLRALVPERSFPFPKSLYAVEDSLRFFLKDKPAAVILDFFAGSGTTTHAVMRLNRQDTGRRQCISVTNNEVAADEQQVLRKRRFRPGDTDWESCGICEYITKPRIAAAVTGKTPEGVSVKGDYKFTDEFPIAEGLEANVEFFTLTYEAPLRVASHREFKKIAPLLWLRAGARGRRIESIADGWDVADTYGVLANLDRTKAFLKKVIAANELSIAYIVTDEDRLFESVAQKLPDHVEPVRLYEAYLRNFEIESGRGAP
ncbi:MAG: DNA methyltransferase [Myxococcales bacterium]|nr:DNA methyltransferase [Myxococcales bacterium]